MKLKKLSCDYSPREDRIRIAGETEAGEKTVFWLTQRILRPVILHLLKWLEQDAALTANLQSPESGAGSQNREAVQSFEQQNAAAELQQQEPVAVSADAQGGLITEINIRTGENGVILAFRYEAETSEFGLQTRQLRQWLQIIQKVWSLAGWPGDLWPGWMQGSPQVSTREHSHSMH